MREKPEWRRQPTTRGLSAPRPIVSHRHSRFNTRLAFRFLLFLSLSLPLSLFYPFFGGMPPVIAGVSSSVWAYSSEYT